MKRSKSAIILLSGGQDSTTCLAWAMTKFHRVFAIGFDYGQSHVEELEHAQMICDQIDIDYKIFDVKNLLASSSLTDHSDHNKKSYVDASLPASFTSGRNILFLTIAASYGAEMGINNLVTGVCQTDFSGYPDCRKVTMDAMQNTLSLGMGNGDYIIYTPLMYLDKAETWKMAKDLGILDIIINSTITDYNADMKMNEWGYGNPDNPATKLRMNGYYKAKKLGWL